MLRRLFGERRRFAFSGVTASRRDPRGESSKRRRDGFVSDVAKIRRCAEQKGYSSRLLWYAQLSSAQPLTSQTRDGRILEDLTAAACGRPRLRAGGSSGARHETARKDTQNGSFSKPCRKQTAWTAGRRCMIGSDESLPAIEPRTWYDPCAALMPQGLALGPRSYSMVQRGGKFH